MKLSGKYKHVISIHSLREKGDLNQWFTPCSVHISIHSLREKGDLIALIILHMVTLFQSTPFVRRETSNLYGSKVTCKISIHSLREKGDTGPEPNNPGHYISIHSLREKGDKIKLTVVRAITHFNPLPS